MMSGTVAYRDLDEALRRAGTSWNGAQSHGLLCSRLAVSGAAAREEWIARLAEPVQAGGEGGMADAEVLDAVFSETHRQLAERQSEFEPLLPDDTHTTGERAAALAHWCEGFLHGLVSGSHGDDLKQRLASQPLSEIIKDLLQITRAAADEEAEPEESEEAYAELVEYVRVAVQLAYEELAAARTTE